MENLQFLGKEWEFYRQYEAGEYTTITEYTYEGLTLTIKSFFDPVFGTKISWTIGDDPSYGIEITSGDKNSMTYAMRALERKLKKLEKLFN